MIQTERLFAEEVDIEKHEYDEGKRSAKPETFVNSRGLNIDDILVHEFNPSAKMTKVEQIQTI